MNKVPFESLDPRDNRIDKQGKTYLIATGEHSAITGVRTSAVVDVRRGEGGGEYLDCAFAGGSGEVLLAFAEDGPGWRRSPDSIYPRRWPMSTVITGNCLRTGSRLPIRCSTGPSAAR